MYLQAKYKNLYWLWGADWKFSHEGNCSTSQSLPSDAEQLSRVMEFSICTSQPLWILFLTYCSFDNCIQAWMCVILSIICWNSYIFRWRDARFSVFEHSVTANFKMLTSKCLAESWCQHDVNISKITSKLQNHHPDIMHKSSLTPPE